MNSREEAERNWYIGTMEVGGYAVPIMARGKTREEAEKQARQDIMAFQVERLKLERETQSDVSQMASRINSKHLPDISD
jgi:hypothetical protein